jgi:hypothetical protein
MARRRTTEAWTFKASTFSARARKTVRTTGRVRCRTYKGEEEADDGGLDLYGQNGLQPMELLNSDSQRFNFHHCPRLYRQLRRWPQNL